MEKSDITSFICLKPSLIQAISIEIIVKIFSETTMAVNDFQPGEANISVYLFRPRTLDNVIPYSKYQIACLPSHSILELPITS